MADLKLEQYRCSLVRMSGQKVPKFAKEARHTAPILAVFESPDKSGAARSLMCSLDNTDPTAKRTVRMIGEAGLTREQIVFWNFYAAYGARDEADRGFWADRLSSLIKHMPKLRVIVVFGDVAWRGMRDVEIPTGITLVGAPHPSNRSCNANTDAERLIGRAWKKAKDRLRRAR